MQDIISVISRPRLDSYDGNTDEEKLNNYYKNRCLAIKAFHKCGEIEIYLRNKFISCFPAPNNCLNSITSSGKLNDDQGNTDKKFKNKTVDQIISLMSFGELIYLIDFCKKSGQMLDLKKMDFRKYNLYNPRSLWVSQGQNQKKKKALTNIDKFTIALELVRVIRNRAAHWENLQKTRIDKSGKVQPRITTKYYGDNYFGILPECILDFLDDLISYINVVDMGKYKDIEKLMGI